jgi:ATP-dependent DNA ligase
MAEKVEQTKWFMLCGSTTEIQEQEKFDDKDNEYDRYNTSNIKYDGERVMAIKKDADVILLNRRGSIVNSHFREVVEAFKGLSDDDFIIDGEIISTTDDFNALQKRALTKNPTKIKYLQEEIPVVYMVFDILQKGEDDYTNYYGQTLRGRLKVLTEMFKDKTINFVKLAEFKPVKEMLAQAKAENREGIIVKNWDSHYYKGQRGEEWKKLKFFEETILKVVRYSENPKGIRAEDEGLNAVQIAGGQSKDVKYLIDTQGYAEINIQFLEKTAEGRFRFPSFRGLVKGSLNGVVKI